MENVANAERRPNGRTVDCPGGYRAYVPASLPPPLGWDIDLVRSLSAADQAVGRLAGEGRRLPNPHLLIAPFVRREAVLSSRIEGTVTTLGQVLAAEAGAAVEQNPDDLREVVNYVTALEYGLDRLDALPLSLRLVREVHEQLMRGVRGDFATPGEFRRSQNWIGPPGCNLSEATYVPPPFNELMGCLGDWERFLHELSMPPLVHAALVHSQFEAIHPFLDGNGRVGRLLITLLLVERRVMPSPLLYLSAYFESTRDEYYARLLAVTEHGEWEEWLDYFLRGVTLQAEDALLRIQRIDDLFSRWRGLLTDSQSALPVRALDLLTENPFWTVSGLAQSLGVAFSTAQRTIDRLGRAGIVQLVRPARRNRVYFAPEMLAVLEGPSAPTGSGSTELAGR